MFQPIRRGLFGASWGSDDTIIFSAQGVGISKVPAGGGTPTEVTKGDAGKSEGRHILPHILPGGKAMLYTAAANLTDWEQTNIIAERWKLTRARLSSVAAPMRDTFRRDTYCT